MASKSRKIGEFVVETGTPPPKRKASKNRAYPFVEMLVGESVFIPGKGRASLRGSLQYASMKTQGVFVAQTEHEGTRVWRTN